MPARPVESEAEQFFRLLGNPVAGIRAIRRDDHPDQRLAVGFFSDAHEFADTVCGLSAASEGPELYQGVFTTVNQLADHFHLMVRGIVGTGQTVKEKDVSRVRILPLDIDPIRGDAQGGKLCSSDTEHQAAIDAAQRAAEIGKSLGWPEPMIIDSGNGAYCFWRVDLPNTPESRSLIKAAIAHFKAQLDNEQVEVDDSVHNPDRVFRIPGTINRKSPDLEERPNRLVHFLSAPESLNVITVDQLKIHRLDSIEPDEHPDQQIQHEKNQPLSSDIHERRVQAVIAWMNQAGFPPAGRKDDGQKTDLAFSHCPFKGQNHKDGGSAVLVFRDGGRGFKCFHKKVCPDKHFKDLERLFRLKFVDVAGPMASAQATGRSDRSFDDPLLLAERHLNKWRTPDRTHTLAFICGETWRFDNQLGWIVLRNGDLDPWIRETVQEVFDEHAEILSEITKEPKTPRPIRGQLVADTFKAMQSLCKREVLQTAQAPFWLERFNDWDPEDLLVFKNCILNVRRYIEDASDCTVPVTPKLFFEHRAAFDFDANATREPPHWFQFLASLDRDENWIPFLQEIMGYCLWQKYDLQKFFVLIGPTRSGKGTINGVLENLVGGKPAVCGLSLQSFVDQFGLESAIAKRIAFVPEIRLPNNGVHDIVANLKAITGGDLVQVKRKHIANLSMRLQLKIVMSTNEFVPLPDNSGALQARMLPLRFTKSFRGKEDLELAEKLSREYSSILLWALDGLKRLRHNDGRFTLPESTREQLRQLTEASAPLQAFVEECCVVDQSSACHSPSLYAVYERWHQTYEPETKKLNNTEFADAMRATEPTLERQRLSKAGDIECKGRRVVSTEFDRNNRAECWLGIAPKPEWRSNVSNEAA